jgi:hypothetical protein
MNHLSQNQNARKMLRVLRSPRGQLMCLKGPKVGADKRLGRPGHANSVSIPLPEIMEHHGTHTDMADTVTLF